MAITKVLLAFLGFAAVAFGSKAAKPEERPLRITDRLLGASKFCNPGQKRYAMLA